MSVQTQIDRIKGNVIRSLSKIAEKGVVVPADANSDNLEELIGNIPESSGVELPTLDNPGTANDLVRDKQLIDGNGNVVTGNISERKNDGKKYGWTGATPYELTEQVGIGLFKASPIDSLFREGCQIALATDPANFGDAIAEDVAKGKTFTSVSGLLVEGTHECSEGVTLPELTNPGSANDLASGMQLIDENGNVITGSVSTVNNGTLLLHDDEPIAIVGSKDDMVIGFTRIFSSPRLFRAGGKVGLYTPAANFGDAELGDVLEDKKFTSKVGYQAQGSMPNNGDTSQSINGIDTKSVTIPAGYTSGGTISLDDSIDNAVANAITALAEKGVTVPSNADVRDLASLISSIEASSEIVIDTAEATPNTNNTLSLNFTGLEKEPTFFIVAPSVTVTLSTSSRYVANIIYDGKKVMGAYAYGASSSSSRSLTYSETAYSYTYSNGTLTVTSGSANTGGYFANGKKYRLLVIYADVVGGGSSSNGGSSSGGGSVIKRGTTTSISIETGLSEIEEFFIYKKTQTATGLINLHYSKTEGTSYLYASTWSTIQSGTKTITHGTTDATVSGGRISIPNTTASSGGLSSGVTYTWVAIGKE